MGCLSAREKWANLPWEQRSAIFLKAAELIAGPYRSKINAATMIGQSKTIAVLSAINLPLPPVKTSILFAKNPVANASSARSCSIAASANLTKSGNAFE